MVAKSVAQPVASNAAQSPTRSITTGASTYAGMNGTSTGHWPFAGDALDVSGNNNHGTPTDITWG